MRSHPGSHLRELERLVPMSLGALRHHLGRLEAGGFVRVEYDRRFKRYFPAELPPLDRPAASAVRHRQLRRILAAALERPGSRHAEFAHALGIPPSSLSTYLHRLVAVGLLALGADGGYSVARPEAVVAALRRSHVTFVDQLVDAATDLLESTEAAQHPPTSRDDSE